MTSPWKEFKCSAMLELSWYLNLTIFLKTEALFIAFLVSNMIKIFFQRTPASISSLKLQLYNNVMNNLELGYKVQLKYKLN